MLSAIYLLVVGLMFVVCGVAVVKGDRPAQIGGASYIVAWLASASLKRTWFYHGVDVGLAVVDTLFLIVLGFLAWRYDRAWIVFACALEAILVTVHACYALNISIGAGAYLAAQQLATFGVLIAIAIGAGQAWLERSMAKASLRSDATIGS